MYFRDRTTASSSSTAFSLVELLITMAIIGILTTLVIVKYSSFNSAVLLKSQVYELALNLREAQVFSISVRGESNQFRNPYGVYFSTGSPNTYILFRDDDGASAVIYDTSPADEQVGDAFTIDTRFRILRICVNDCSQDVNNVSVSFRRPDFDAHMAVAGVGVVTSAEIIVATVADTSITRSVRINSTGQIQIE
ncbi:MAG: type II secretion system protein [Candidatus Paceibacterota bacterium]